MGTSADAAFLNWLQCMVMHLLLLLWSLLLIHLLIVYDA
jgi:hypothetical protein